MNSDDFQEEKNGERSSPESSKKSKPSFLKSEDFDQGKSLSNHSQVRLPQDLPDLRKPKGIEEKPETL